MSQSAGPNMSASQVVPLLTKDGKKLPEIVEDVEEQGEGEVIVEKETFYQRWSYMLWCCAIFTVIPLATFLIYWLLSGAVAGEISYEHKHTQNHAKHWDYENEGPSNWPGTCRNGKLQSPINIDTDKLQHTDSKSAISFSLYDKKMIKANLTNTGHTGSLILKMNILTNTAQLIIPSSTSPSIQGGMLRDKYYLHSIHFHWSNAGHVTGSEHTRDGESYPLEAHFVHVLSGYSIASALGVADGLAVIGVQYDVDESNSTKVNTPDWHMLEMALENIITADTKSVVPALTLMNLLPADRRSFYRYKGSLTTPPCTEVVVWTMMKDVMKVPRSTVCSL